MKFRSSILIASSILSSLVSCGGGSGPVDIGPQLAAAGVECSAGNSGGWCWQQPVPVPHHTYDVQFLDGAKGWAVGDGGFVTTTGDGGRSWTRQNSPVSEDLSLVRFVDANHGYAIANQSARIMASTDGGRSWALRGSFAPLSSVQQLWLTQAGILVASGPLPGAAAYKTVVSIDGGVAWRAAAMPRVTHVGRSGTLWSLTSDGLWVSRDLGLSAAVALPCSGCTTSTMDLDDDGALAVVTSERSATGVMVNTRYASNDAGRTWTSIAIAAINRNDGSWSVPLALTGGGVAWGATLTVLTSADGRTSSTVPAALWRSTDSGATWSGVTVPAWIDLQSATLSSDSFLDGQTMWFTSAGRAVITTDAGKSWRQLDVAGETQPPVRLRVTGDRILVATFGRFEDRWYTSSDGAGQWLPVPGGRDDSDISYGSPWFLDESRGFVMALDGALRVTVDGGATWQSQALSGAPDRGGSVQFTPDGVGWLVAGGRLYRSSDEGQSWNMQDALRGITGATFVDATHGWVITQQCTFSGQIGSCVQTINRTVDGGLSWQALRSFQDSIAIAFADANVGIMKTFDSTIYRTSDGGLTWSPAATDAPVTGVQQAIYFRTPSDGWILPASGRPVALHTTDAGKSWAQVPLPDGSTNRYDIRFADAQHGWIVGAGGFILHTSDGGATWQKQASGTGLPLFGIFALDRDRVWIAGARSTILATNKGGD